MITCVVISPLFWNGDTPRTNLEEGPTEIVASLLQGEDGCKQRGKYYNNLPCLTVFPHCLVDHVPFPPSTSLFSFPLLFLTYIISISVSFININIENCPRI